MFALAIWDGRDRTLFVARDRLGKKPLFYYFDGKVFIFASEPKSILVDPETSVKPDVQAINHYLTYLYVPSPLSAFQGFRKLPPAHYLTVREGSLRVERYWRLRYSQKLNCPEEELCEQLRHHLREAVRLRMISDVPLGAFLSGGIDSSAVVAYMSELSGGPVKTFSIGFEEEKYNELPFARRIAKLFGTDHHEFVVKPNAVEILPDLVWHYNEPYADSSAVPTYYLSKLARQHVTVALNGDAGDENFAGYFSRYRAILRYEMIERLPIWLREGLALTSNLLPDSDRLLLKRWKRLIGHEGPYEKFARGISFFTDDMRVDLLSEEFRTQVGAVDPLSPVLEMFATSDAQNLLDAALDVDVTTYLPDDLLVKVDIASMAHSLEARSPFVDHVLMEFAARIPANMKLRRGTGKYILKKAMAGILPPELIHREKMGFGIPLDRWCRSELRELISETLLSPQAIGRGYFRAAAVRRLIDEHVLGVAKWHHQLWALLMLELWHRTFIDKRPSLPRELPGQVVSRPLERAIRA
jgi:asparagine synthase (glutamine-hydrolysing)